MQHLIHETYPQPLIKEATQPRQHLENATKQNENWQNWKAWADETERLYNDVRQAGQMLTQSLDDLKQENSLQKIDADCDKTIMVIDKLQVRFNDKPVVAPLSEKARRDSERVKANVLNTIQTSLAQAKRLKLEVVEEQNKLNEPRGPLNQLRGAITVLKGLETRQGAVPHVQVEMAKKFINACEVIDPQNDELREHRKYLQILKFR